MDRLLQLLTVGVQRFEGTVHQFTGDGILAIFGVPLAHEDHARRACHAALLLQKDLASWDDELRSSHDLTCSVRIGLNSGEVIVGDIGDEGSMAYTAIGHTVGLAKRIEELTEPGQVWVSEHTAALVEGYFALRDLGTFEIKGVDREVRVHQVDG